VLGRIPGLRWLFSTNSRVTLNTETVVIITPRLVDEDEVVAMNDQANEIFEENQREMIDKSEVVRGHIEDTFRKPPPSGRAPLGGTAEVEPESAGDVITQAAPEQSAPEQRALSPSAAPVAVPKPEAPAAVAAADAAPVVENEATTAPDFAMPAEGAAPSPAAAPEPVAPRPSATARYAINLHSDPQPIEVPNDAAPDDRLLYVSEKQLDGETWYRLRLGFFETEDEARAALDDWLPEYPNAWAVRVAPAERDSAL
jgi:type II secretory pathway component HofQ